MRGTISRRTLLGSAASLLLNREMKAGIAELNCDIAVIGGSVGGFAAALAALRNGMRVVLTEETDWIGGQLTSQAVPPDEHPWIRAVWMYALLSRIPNGCPRLLPETLPAHKRRARTRQSESRKRNGFAAHA